MTNRETIRAQENLEEREQSLPRETEVEEMGSTNQATGLATEDWTSEDRIQLKTKYVDQPEDSQPESMDQWKNPDLERETGWILDLEDLKREEKKRKQADPEGEQEI